MRIFNIFRDCSYPRYQPKSDQPIVTQFDTGIAFNFFLLENNQPCSLAGSKVFLSFKNDENDVLFTTECTVTQDLSTNPTTQITYISDERLTLRSGLVHGILDLVDAEGYRTAFPTFGIVIHPHLLDEPASIDNQFKRG